jgi:hypothetical protein
MRAPPLTARSFAEVTSIRDQSEKSAARLMESTDSDMTGTISLDEWMVMMVEQYRKHPEAARRMLTLYEAHCNKTGTRRRSARREQVA